MPGKSKLTRRQQVLRDRLVRNQRAAARAYVDLAESTGDGPPNAIRELAEGSGPRAEPVTEGRRHASGGATAPHRLAVTARGREVVDPDVPVFVYIKPFDVSSDATIRLLKTRGIPFTAVDVTQSGDAVSVLRALNYSRVPVVITNDDHWSGFRPDRITKLNSLGRGENGKSRRRSNSAM